MTQVDKDLPETVTARPRKSRIACWVGAVVLVTVFSAVATGLRGSMGDGTDAVFQPGDQAAMVGLGLLGAGAILLFTRPKVVADRAGIRVRNVIGSYELPWQVVRAVTFRTGTPWVLLDLQDDDQVAVMAVQAADKGYAVDTVRRLRALHTAAVTAPADQAGRPTRPGGPSGPGRSGQADQPVQE